jgi:hypothetical protein
MVARRAGCGGEIVIVEMRFLPIREEDLMHCFEKVSTYLGMRCICLGKEGEGGCVNVLVTSPNKGGAFEAPESRTILQYASICSREVCVWIACRTFRAAWLMGRCRSSLTFTMTCRGLIALERYDCPEGKTQPSRAFRSSKNCCIVTCVMSAMNANGNWDTAHCSSR